ncbi:MAG: signal peptidase I [Desulfurococcales archaeon]|nr:signal peptidase I [Desulfurococcales archaeon]
MVARLLRILASIMLAASLVSLVLLYGYAIFFGGFAVVEGRSMEPLLHTGDLVFLDKRGQPDIGSVVVYKDKSGRFIIHRVIGVYEYNNITCYVIKGDNNSIPDYGYPDVCRRPYRVGPYSAYGVPESRIVGVVISLDDSPVKVPYLGGLTILYKG